MSARLSQRTRKRRNSLSYANVRSPTPAPPASGHSHCSVRRMATKARYHAVVADPTLNDKTAC